VRWLCRPFAAVRFSYGDPLGLGQGRAVVAHSSLATRQVRGLRDGSLLCSDGERAEFQWGNRAKEIAEEEFYRGKLQLCVTKSRSRFYLQNKA
jgi:hypothetical protein